MNDASVNSFPRPGRLPSGVAHAGPRPVSRPAGFLRTLPAILAAALLLCFSGNCLARDMRFLDEMKDYLSELLALSEDMYTVEKRIDVARKAINRLEAQSPLDPADKHDWSLCYILILNNLGPSYVAKREYAEGRAYLLKAVAIAEEALAEAPGDKSILVPHFLSQRMLAISYRMQSNHRLCASRNEDALYVVRGLLKRDPDDRELLKNMREILLELGQSYLILEEWENARESCREAVELARKAIAEDPNDADARWDLAEGLARRKELEQKAAQANARDKPK